MWLGCSVPPGIQDHPYLKFPTNNGHPINHQPDHFSSLSGGESVQTGNDASVAIHPVLELADSLCRLADLSLQASKFLLVVFQPLNDFPQHKVQFLVSDVDLRVLGESSPALSFHQRQPMPGPG